MYSRLVVVYYWSYQTFYFSQIFCDFGDNFVVTDVDGEQPITNMVASITKVKKFLTSPLFTYRILKYCGFSFFVFVFVFVSDNFTLDSNDFYNWGQTFCHLTNVILVWIVTLPTKCTGIECTPWCADWKTIMCILCMPDN